MKLKPAIFYAAVFSTSLLMSAEGAAPALLGEHPAVTIMTNGGKDPLAGFNQPMESTNAFLAKYILHPVSIFYCHMVPDCVSERIGKFTDNILFPVRLANNCLQGKFQNAWDETKRFGVNTTVGVLGFGDPASDMSIPRHDEDFGQTLDAWGVGDGCYLNLPLMGPSTVRDAPALIVDHFLNPVNYISPFIMTGLNSNLQLRRAAFINNYFRTHYVTYPLTRTMHLASRDVQLRDGAFPPVTTAPDESLGILKLAPRDRLFYTKAGHRSLAIPCAPRKLTYTYFRQKNNDAKIMFILPGLTTTRLDVGMTALAELFYNQGWTVAIVSSTFTADFFLGTQTPVPGLLRRDAECLDAALTLIREDIARNLLNTDATPHVAVLGVSLGGINALLLSELDAKGTGTLKPARVISVNPPRNPFLAMQKLDELYDLPLTWPAETRLEKARTAIERIAYAVMNPKVADLKLNNDESLFLIGLEMRLGMVDLLAEIKENPASRQLIPQCVNLEDDEQFVRDALAMSYTKYAETVLIPYARQQKYITENDTVESVGTRNSVDSIAANLTNYSKLRLIHTRNDFFLAPGDAEWFQKAFGERCILFSNGSHLGFLSTPEAQNTLVLLSK